MFGLGDGVFLGLGDGVFLGLGEGVCLDLEGEALGLGVLPLLGEDLGVFDVFVFVGDD